MGTRATRPLNPSAVAAANASFYAAHPEMIRDGKPVPIDPCDARQAGLRQEWMAAYSRGGGAVEPIGGPAQAGDVRSVGAQIATAPAKALGKPVLACPQPSRPAPSEVPKILPPPREVPQSSDDKPCKLVSMTLKCGHGRQQGPEQILMVVPDAAGVIADTVAATLSFTGGCGEHPEWMINGALAKAGSGTAFQFAAASETVGIRSFVGPRSISPVVYQVSGESCAGGRNFEIWAYPSGKASGTYSTDELKRSVTDKFTEKLAHLPIAPSNWEKPEVKWLQGSVSFQVEWKEDTTWQTYCDRSIIIGLDPLLEVSSRFKVYGPPIPKFIAKYADAGIYIKVTGGFSLTGSGSGRYFPYTSANKLGKIDGELNGSIELSLLGEIEVMGGEVAGISVSGDTEVFASGSLGYEDEFFVNAKVGWGGLVAKFSVKLSFGWISAKWKSKWLDELEYADEWKLVEGNEFPFPMKFEK